MKTAIRSASCEHPKNSFAAVADHFVPIAHNETGHNETGQNETGKDE
jgi:hypothetical protein